LLYQKGSCSSKELQEILLLTHQCCLLVQAWKNIICTGICKKSH
jgi:hypothetical protein